MFYRVLPKYTIPASAHEYGYESTHDFLKALRRLHDRWHGHIGECLASRHAFLLLRFRSARYGVTEDVWMPNFMLAPSPPPPDWSMRQDPFAVGREAEAERELDRIFRGG